MMYIVIYESKREKERERECGVPCGNLVISEREVFLVVILLFLDMVLLRSEVLLLVIL